LSINEYGFAGLFVVPATVVKLLYDHSNLVILPPLPVVVNVTASFTVVEKMFAVRVPEVVGVVHGATHVRDIVNVPTSVEAPVELQYAI